MNGTYSDPAYEDLIFKDSKTGKKVMFTTASPTQALVDRIEAPGKIIVQVSKALHRRNFGLYFLHRHRSVGCDVLDTARSVTLARVHSHALHPQHTHM